MYDFHTDFGSEEFSRWMGRTLVIMCRPLCAATQSAVVLSSTAALMKIFFGLLPREHLSKFENLRQWIIDRDKNSKIFSPLTVIKTRLNGYSTATLDVIILHKPVTTIEEFQKSPARENYEYLGYIRFGSITFEIPLLTDLSFEKLNIMKQSNIKTEFSFPHIPKPGYPIDYEILDFSETKKIRDVETMYFGYTKMTETKLD